MGTSLHKSLAMQDQKNTIFDKYVLTCVLDLSFDMVDASRAFVDFLGYEKLSTAKTRYKFFSPKNIDEHSLIKIKELLALGHTYTGELKNTNVSAQDFFLDITINPMNDESGKRVAYFCILHDITHQKRLQEISITDSLTHLYNKEYFDIYLKQSLFSSIKGREIYSLMFLEIDEFASYNKSHGNIMGDKAIARIASAIKKNKYIDAKKLFRVGGTKFAVVIQNENAGYLRALVQSVLDSVSALEISHDDSEISNIMTLSVGVVGVYTCMHHISDSEIVSIVDINLSKAKENGGNQAVFDVDDAQIDKSQCANLVSSLPSRGILVNDISLLQENSMLIVLHLNHINTLKNIYGINEVTSIITKKTEKLLRIVLDKEVTLYSLNFQEFAILVKKENLHEKYLSLIQYSILEDTMMNADSFEDANDSLVSFTAGIAYGTTNILNHADIVLQEAILNKVSFLTYSNSTHNQTAHVDTIDRMRVYKKALIEGGIIPYFQPILDAKTGEVFKYEALARLINDEGEIVSPYYFLRESKEDKTFEAFSKQMMQKVFNVYSKNRIDISVNVTYENIASESMIYYIKNRLDKYGGEGITFEIVESEEILDYNIVEEFVVMVKSYGCKVSIDDFGSGYSNFTNILVLNIDYIKIDGSLIEKLLINDNILNIVKALVSFSKEAGMKTIAEYVSSYELSQVVQELGIDFSQGYYYSEAKSAADLGFEYDEI